MAQESTKSLRRRYCEDAQGIFPWRKILVGPGIDVGAGDDLIPIPGFVPFDKEHGNAERLSEYFPHKSQKTIHSSQCAEHMSNPLEALLDWMKLLKKGGHLVWTVPDVGAYENFVYPSRHNPDHRASFSMIYRGSTFPIHYHLPTMMESFKGIAEVLLCRYVETNLDWNERTKRDLTWNPSEQCEMWNEVVLRKSV